ncbi:hypothetical protein JX265_002004 [Neoarthrinium moseri]|uniref:Uncharacterized protein n=1 Tax=Neoarthrinium moseri TaxID=1658444 RepID=A0A9Q0AV51_9PEZI|nr:hypothetical protein JX265_002004 [Neoarthrinium moseri]
MGRSRSGGKLRTRLEKELKSARTAQERQTITARLTQHLRKMDVKSQKQQERRLKRTEESKAILPDEERFAAQPYTGGGVYQDLDGVPVVAKQARTLSTWKGRNDALLEASPIFSFHFLPSMNVSDVHIHDLVARGASVSMFLEDFRAGSYCSPSAADITDDGVHELAKACSRLKQVSLEGAWQLTSAAVSVLFQSCPDLEYLCITGTKDNTGSITGQSLAKLADLFTGARKLRCLVLLRQRNLRGPCLTTLSHLRPDLEIRHSVGPKVRTYFKGDRLYGNMSQTSAVKQADVPSTNNNNSAKITLPMRAKTTATTSATAADRQVVVLSDESDESDGDDGDEDRRQGAYPKATEGSQARCNGTPVVVLSEDEETVVEPCQGGGSDIEGGEADANADYILDVGIEVPGGVALG